jgi:predicted nucleic acid-binding protein
MSRYVVDASVGVKWFLPEPGAIEAARLQDPANELHVPAFFDLEIANIFWRAVRQGRLTRPEADVRLAQLAGLSLPRHPEGPLVTAAFDIAHATARTVYDSLYVALAAHVGAVMVTADDRLVNALAGTPWAGQIMRLVDVP